MLTSSASRSAIATQSPTVGSSAALAATCRSRPAATARCSPPPSWTRRNRPCSSTTRAGRQWPRGLLQRGERRLPGFAPAQSGETRFVVVHVAGALSSILPRHASRRMCCDWRCSRLLLAYRLRTAASAAARAGLPHRRGGRPRPGRQPGRGDAAGRAGGQAAGAARPRGRVPLEVDAAGEGRFVLPRLTKGKRATYRIAEATAARPGAPRRPGQGGRRRRLAHPGAPSRCCFTGPGGWPPAPTSSPSWCAAATSTPC